MSNDCKIGNSIRFGLSKYRYSHKYLSEIRILSGIKEEKVSIYYGIDNFSYESVTAYMLPEINQFIDDNDSQVLCAFDYVISFADYKIEWKG